MQRDEPASRASPSSLRRADRQALAPLGATTLEHDTAVLAGHTDEKTMGPLAAAAIGLIRALHWAPCGAFSHRRNMNRNGTQQASQTGGMVSHRFSA